MQYIIDVLISENLVNFKNRKSYKKENLGNYSFERPRPKVDAKGVLIGPENKQKIRQKAAREAREAAREATRKAREARFKSAEFVEDSENDSD
eukprot:Pgem_evm1s11243